MNKIFAVIRREFVARVRTRAFVISTLLLPVFIVAMTVLPALMMRGSDHTSRIAVVDASSNGIGNALSQALMREKLSDQPGAQPRYSVQVFPVTVAHLAERRDALIASTGIAKRNDADAWNGVLVLTDDSLVTGNAAYYGDNVGAVESMGKIQGTLSQVLATVRLGQSGVNADVVMHSMVPADLQTTRVSDGKLTGQSGAESFAVAYFMGFILYLSILIYGQQTMTSVIEEKTSRIMEVLASSLTPFQMLLGKVLGVGSAGLTQMAIWGGTVFIVGNQRAHLASLFGISSDAMQGFPVPTMAPGLLVVFLLYFMLGFLLFGALYAAIGAMCNTIQETQQYAVFVTIVIMVGFFAVFSLIKDPTGDLGRTMSFIPFFAPFVMPVRWSMTSVPPLELALSLGLMMVTLLACVWLAGRIYRTGILMYGKKPSWKELLRWIRA